MHTLKVGQMYNSFIPWLNKIGLTSNINWTTKVHCLKKMVPCPWFDLWPWPLTSVLEDLFVLFTHPLLLQISGCVKNLFQLGPLWLHVLQNILFKKKVNNCTFVCYFLSMTIRKIFSKRWTQLWFSINKLNIKIKV